MPKGIRGSRPQCRIAECEKSSRAFGLCAMHESRLRRNGDPLAVQRVRLREPIPCLVCGQNERVDIQSFKFCSKACEQHWSRHGGVIPAASRCVECGVALKPYTKKGQRRRVTAKFCETCSRNPRHYHLSVGELAERDGASCALCGELVDLGLTRSESRMCASVDHIIPRSLGGSHEPSNLQLAHLACNARKSNRVEV